MDKTYYEIETKDGVLAEDGEAELKKLFAALETADKPKLVLHAHGGLVDKAAAQEQACFIDQTFKTLEGWERAYLLWHTGIWDVLGDGLERGTNNRLSRDLREQGRDWGWRRIAANDKSLAPDPKLAPRRTIKARLQRLGEADAEGNLREAAIRASVDEHLRRGAAFVAFTREIDEVARSSNGGARVTGAGDARTSWNNLDERLRVQIARGIEARAANPTLTVVSGALAAVLILVLIRVLAHRDHGAQATFVEEFLRVFSAGLIGPPIWNAMKDDAKAHFANAGSAGTKLLDGLIAIAAKKDVELVIVGHSAGCILALHLLTAAKPISSKLKISMVFWAPAASHKLTAELLDDAAVERLSRFAMYCLTDKAEKADALDGHVAGLYPRSLLYLVSGLLEQDTAAPHPDAPLLGMERHRKPELVRRLTKDEKRHRARVMAVLGKAKFPHPAWTCPCGGDCTSETHGSFSCDITAHVRTVRLILDDFKPEPKCPGHA